MARVIAFRVPASIDQEAGQAVLATVDRAYAPSQLGRAEKARVQAQLQRLYPERPKTELPKIVFRRMGIDQVNAFALPGGTIVVADELVRLPASDDELAAVLAHEEGHILRRHAIQSVLRSSFALLFVSGVTVICRR